MYKDRERVAEMKKGLLVVGLLLLLTGCNGEKQSVENDIKEYESEIEKALLMDNDYQEAKYTSCLEELEKYLEEVREQHSFKVTSKYEGLTLDEALEKYNKENGTKLTNLTEESAPEREKELAEIEKNRDGGGHTSLLQGLIDDNEGMFEDEKTSIGRYVFLSGIAEKMVECEGKCTSNLISFEDSKKWVETGEYNEEWTYVDGEYAMPEATESEFKPTVPVSIVEESTIYDNYIEVKGKLVNNTENAYSFVQIKVDLKDSNGNIIDTKTTYAVGGETLYPNDTKKWDVRFDTDSRVDHVTAFVIEYKTR